MNQGFDHHFGEDLAAMADEGRGLSADRRDDLLRHAADCEECRAALASAKLVLSAVGQVREPEPSSAFDGQLFSRIDALDREARNALAQPGFWDRVKELFTLPRVGALVATAAGVAAFVILGAPDRTGPGPNDNPLAQVPPEVAREIDGLAMAEDLDLYRDLDIADELELLEDLEAIEAIEIGG